MSKEMTASMSRDNTVFYSLDETSTRHVTFKLLEDRRSGIEPKPHRKSTFLRRTIDEEREMQKAMLERVDQNTDEDFTDSDTNSVNSSSALKKSLKNCREGP